RKAGCAPSLRWSSRAPRSARARSMASSWGTPIFLRYGNIGFRGGEANGEWLRVCNLAPTMCDRHRGDRPMKVSSLLAAGVAAALTLSTNAATPEKLKEPSQITATAPDVFKARFDTTKGAFVIEVHRDWSPAGADRFYALVK